MVDAEIRRQARLYQLRAQYEALLLRSEVLRRDTTVDEDWEERVHELEQQFLALADQFAEV